MKFLKLIQKSVFKEARLLNVTPAENQNNNTELPKTPEKAEAVDFSNERSDAGLDPASMLIENIEQTSEVSKKIEKLKEKKDPKNKELLEIAQIAEKNPNTITSQNISSLLFLADKITATEKYHTIMDIAYLNNQLVLDQISIQIFAEKFQDTNDDAFNKLIDICKRSTQSLDTLIKSSSNEKQKEMIVSTITPEYLLRLTTIDIILPFIKLDQLLISEKEAILINEHLNINTKIDLVKNYITDPNAKPETIAMALSQIAVKNTNEFKLITESINEKTMLEVINSQLSNNLDPIIIFENGSIKFAIITPDEQGNEITSLRSFTLDNETKTAIFKAQSTDEIKNIVFSRLGEIVEKVKNKKHYQETIDGYETSNKLMKEWTKEYQENKETKEIEEAIKLFNEVKEASLQKNKNFDRKAFRNKVDILHDKLPFDKNIKARFYTNFAYLYYNKYTIEVGYNYEEKTIQDLIVVKDISTSIINNLSNTTEGYETQEQYKEFEQVAKENLEFINQRLLEKQNQTEKNNPTQTTTTQEEQRETIENKDKKVDSYKESDYISASNNSEQAYRDTVVATTKLEDAKKENNTEEIQRAQKELDIALSEKINADSIKKSITDKFEARYSELIKMANGETIDHQVHPSLSSMSEEELSTNFENLYGAERVTRLLESKSLAREKAQYVAAEIMHELIGSNEFTFEDVYEVLYKYKLIKSKHKDAEDFASEMIQTDPQSPEMKADYTLCMDLIDALGDLKYDEKRATEFNQETEEDIEHYSQTDKKIIDKLNQLVTSDQASGYDQFLAWITNTPDANEVTLATMEGQSFLNEGFNRHISSNAALKDLLTDKSLYELVNGKPKLKIDAITAKINNLITKGHIQKQLMLGKKPNEKAIPTIAGIDFSTFNEDQIHLFQLGYIVDKKGAVSQEFREAEETLDPNQKTINELMEQSPQFANLISALNKENIPVPVIQKVQSKLLAAGTFHLKIDENNNVSLDGAGVGTSIDLGEGYSLGLGVYKDGEGTKIGAGLSFKIYKGETVQASFASGLSLQGFGLGMSETIDLNSDLALKLKQGVSFGFGDIIPTVGGSIGLKFKLDGMINRDLKEAKEKTDYKELWEKWKNIKSPEEKFAQIQLMPKLKELSDQLQSTYKLTNADVVHIIEGIEDQITVEVLDNSAPIVPISEVGVALVGITPIPYISFRIGTITTFVPNRGKIDKQRAMLKKLKPQQDKALATALNTAMNTSDENLVFEDKAVDVIYGENGENLIVTDSEEIKFRDSFESFNKKLKKVEISLEKVSDGRAKLNIEATEHKDVELHIDPTLKDLAVIKDGQNIYLEGDISNLIITRERTISPFKKSDTSSEVLDIITIRTKKSAENGIDRNTIMSQDFGQFMRKDEGEVWTMQTIGERRFQNNMFEHSYKNSAERAVKGERKITDSFEEDLSTIRETKESKTASIKALLDNRQVSLKTMERNTYKGQKIRANFNGDLNTLFENDEFTEKFGKVADKPTALLTLIQDQFKETPLNNKERNFAINYALTKYFTQIQEQGRSSDKIASIIEKRKNGIYHDVILGQFENALARLEINGDAESLTQQVLNSSFNEVIDQLKGGENPFTHVEKIPAHASMISVSRHYSEGSKKPIHTMASSMNFETNDNFTDETLKAALGLVNNQEYKLGGENNLLARVILEVTSPMPKDAKEFLRSPFALKVGSLEALIFTKELSERDFSNITEILANPDLIKTDSEFENSYKKFRSLAEKIRSAEASGQKTLEFEGRNGEKIVVLINAEVHAGAHSKCSNATLYSTEKLSAKVYTKEGIVVEDYENHELGSNDLGVTEVTAGLGISAETTSASSVNGKISKPGPSKNTRPAKTSNKGTGYAPKIPREDGSTGSKF